MWKLFNQKSEKEEEKVQTPKDGVKGEEKKKSAQGGKGTDKKDKKKEDTPKEKKTSAPAKSNGKLSAGHGIFIKPLVSEKTASMGSMDIYAFAVSTDTNKVEIQKAFKNMYNVKPVSVRIINMPSRTKRFGKNI